MRGEAERQPEAVIFVGVQATGKSSFFRERFFRTHVRVNLDMLRTRHRERALFETCLRCGIPLVVDNTNPAASDRARYIPAAREAGFRLIGYYFESKLAAALERNARRPLPERIPELGVKGAAGRLELPSRREGFDELYYVRLADGDFLVEEWIDEVR
jgi:predicted kinase